MGLPLRVSRNALYVAPMLHSNGITISALPKEIGNLQMLDKLSLGGCRELKGKSRNLLSVTPMLHLTSLFQLCLRRLVIARR